MEFIVGNPEQKKVVQIIGPFRGDIYRLVVDGCEVPYIELMVNDNPQQEWEKDYEWYMRLDNRFGAFVNEDEITRWGMIFANAMAVAAGYTSHGPNSKPMNRFAKRVIELGELPEE